MTLSPLPVNYKRVLRQIKVGAEPDYRGRNSPNLKTRGKNGTEDYQPTNHKVWYSYCWC